MERETRKEMGNTTKGTIKVKIPLQPTRRQMIIVPPMTAKGNIIPASTNGSLVSIELKSLLNKFIIFPNSADFAEKDVSLETLAYISKIIPALILQDIIGIE